MNADPIDERRLKFLLRRGMKELDIMVTRYHGARYPQASESERKTFVQLLNTIEDPDIWSWAMGYSETPDEFMQIIEQLRIYR